MIATLQIGAIQKVDILSATMFWMVVLKKFMSFAKNAGLVITTVGDTFPYGKDDNDSNIRIAPTFTNTNQLDTACKILVCSTKIACLEKLISEK